MARTVSEVAAVCTRLDGQVDAVSRLVAELRASTATATDKQHDTAVELARLRAEVPDLRRQLAESRAGVDRADDVAVTLRKELAEARLETAIIRQRLDDHLKRVELWDTRRWGLVVAVILAVFGSALAFASGLLLATLRTPTK